VISQLLTRLAGLDHIHTLIYVRPAGSHKNIKRRSEPTPSFDIHEDPPTTFVAGDEGEEDVKFGLHPDDPANFLKLCAALRILMQHVLSDTDIDSADTLIRQYNTELIKVCFAVTSTFCEPSYFLVSSFTAPMLSNQTTTTQRILPVLCATSDHFTTSGLFCLSV